MDRHAQRGERRAELVRDRGDQVVVQLVEAAQTRHVLQHDGRRRRRRPRLVVHRRRRAAEDALAVRTRRRDRLLETPRHERHPCPGARAARTRSITLAHRRVDASSGSGSPLARCAAELLGARVRVSAARRRPRRRAPGPAGCRSRPATPAAPQAARRASSARYSLEPLRHRVELAGELRELVARRRRARALRRRPRRASSGLREHRERPHQARREPAREPRRRATARRARRDDQRPRRRGRPLARALALAQPSRPGSASSTRSRCCFSLLGSAERALRSSSRAARRRLARAVQRLVADLGSAAQALAQRARELGLSGLGDVRLLDARAPARSAGALRRAARAHELAAARDARSSAAPSSRSSDSSMRCAASTLR